MPAVTMQQSPYLPLAGRSDAACGVGVGASSVEVAERAHRIAPPGARRCAPPSPSRGGMEFAAISGAIAPPRQTH
jgi:hypothetical protein